MHLMDTPAGDQGDEALDRAMAELMQSMDAFITSWTVAVRRFATEPDALRHFHEARTSSLPDDGLRIEEGPEGPHPLWDRALDG